MIVFEKMQQVKEIMTQLVVCCIIIILKTVMTISSNYDSNRL